MKINKIKALCKSEKHCAIYARGMQRWIGTRNAVYPAVDLLIKRENLSTLFDWPDVEADISIEEAMLEDTLIAPHDPYDREENELKPCCGISYMGENIIPLVRGDMLYFIREEYVSAAEKTEGYTIYTLTQNILGNPLIVIGNGMMTTGIIKPLPRKTAATCGHICRRCQSWWRMDGRTMRRSA